MQHFLTVDRKLFSFNDAHDDYCAQVECTVLYLHSLTCKPYLNPSPFPFPYHPLQSLLLSNLARRDSTTGEIVNLMAIDAQRFMDLTSYLNMVWSAPLQITLSVIFLYQTMGPSVFAGVAVMILLIPVNAGMAVISRRFQVMILRSCQYTLTHLSTLKCSCIPTIGAPDESQRCTHQDNE